MIAARERVRQVWTAPANVPLEKVVGLSTPLSKQDWAELLELRVNVIRREPKDFRLLSAHTLAHDSSLLQLSVRRLMILLRKTAQQLGIDLVFENNDEDLRDAVRLTFDRILRFLFERGAFAGSTPEQAYRVETGPALNTRGEADRGRFIAQIFVAPSQPLEFLTLQLSRSGEGALQAMEV
jgi:phage tail sheath protein FI